MFNLLICYCQVSGENIASFNIWASGRTISGEYLAVYGGEYLENIWDYLYDSSIFVHLGNWEKNIWRISSCLWGRISWKISDNIYTIPTIFVHLGLWEKNIWRMSSCLWRRISENTYTIPAIFVFACSFLWLSVFISCDIGRSSLELFLEKLFWTFWENSRNQIKQKIKLLKRNASLY